MDTCATGGRIAGAVGGCGGCGALVNDKIAGSTNCEAGTVGVELACLATGGAGWV